MVRSFVSFAHGAILILVALTGSAWFASDASAQDTITFDAVAPPGNPADSVLLVGDWRFASSQFHTVSLPAAGVLALVDNGTPYIASVGGGLDFPITLERADGAAFSLFTFDGGEAFLNNLDAAAEGFTVSEKIQVVGEQADGNFILAEFTLDGVKDGLGGAADFQSFVMAQDFHNVTSVTFTGIAGASTDAAFALDNIVVAAVVPEPASWLLAASAAATLLVAGRSRRCVARRKKV